MPITLRLIGADLLLSVKGSAVSKWHWQHDQYAILYDLTYPVVNLLVGTRVLKKAINSTKDLELAIGRYHSWTPERARNYAMKVKRMRDQLGLYMAQNAATPKKQTKENLNG